MTRIILATLALLVGISSVSAADIGGFKDSDASSFESVTNPFGGLYAGLTVGGQFTDITLSNLNFSGLSADGFTGGGLVGFNFAIGRIVAGPYVEFGWSDVSVTVMGEDVLTMDDYTQLGAQLGVLVGKNALLSVHAAREWQNWTAGIEVDASAWVVGIGFDFMLFRDVSLGVKVDYVMLDDVEVDGIEDTDALRAKLNLTYRPQIALPGLESVRF